MGRGKEPTEALPGAKFLKKLINRHWGGLSGEPQIAAATRFQGVFRYSGFATLAAGGRTSS